VLDLFVPRNKRHPSGIADAGFFDEQWKFKND